MTEPTTSSDPCEPLATTKDPQVGSQLGKYLLTSWLGRGGMGVVYAATDTVLRRPVAIKLLPAELGEHGPWRRFLREARAAARLNHPHVVAIYDAGQHDGTCFLVMELVRGPSAQDLLQARGAMPWREATRLIADVCRGLASAHAVGLIHRDVKPANVLRSPDGAGKLADFGLAWAADFSGTSLNGVAGTPQYMSPEQWRGEPLDERSDLYALGSTYYALLVGYPPYRAKSRYQLMWAHCSQAIPNVRDYNPRIPPRCAAIVRRALAKYPAQRYGSATEMLAALEATLAAPDTPRRRRPLLWLLVLLGVLMAGLLGALLIS
jgi:serine/threonine protein kinase